MWSCRAFTFKPSKATIELIEKDKLIKQLAMAIDGNKQQLEDDLPTYNRFAIDECVYIKKGDQRVADGDGGNDGNEDRDDGSDGVRNFHYFNWSFQSGNGIHYDGDHRDVASDSIYKGLA